MRIKILGSRGEVVPSAPYHSKHSGILIDKRLLLDVGEESFLGLKPSSVFITHLHPDHAFFVTKKEPARIEVPVYAPEPHKNLRDIRLIGENLKKITVGAHKLTPIPTHHSKKVKSVAYLVQKGEEKILYTGDLVWINKEYHRLFTALEMVITEASYLRHGGLVRRDPQTGKIYGHTGIPNLVRLFSQYTKRVLLVHFGSWFYRDITESRRQLKRLGRKHGVSLIVGYDGMEFDTGKSGF